MRITRIGWCVLGAVALLAGAAMPAAAQSKRAPTTAPAAAPTRPAPAAPTPTPMPSASTAAAPTQSSGGDSGGNVQVQRGAGGKKVYRIMTEIRIEGKIQKPEAFYVLQKSAINYEWQELRQDFVPKIVESVNQAPF